MLKKSFTLLLLFLLAINGFCKEIPMETAKKTAQTFVENSALFEFKSSALQIIYVGNPLNLKAPVGLQLKSNGANEPMYAFNIGDNNGFIIVSGDDAALPILGYSSTGSITTELIPSNVRKWLEGYKQQIAFIQENNLEQTVKIKKLWNGNYPQFKSTNAVAPLVETQWNQAPYVNDLCPYDYDYYERAVTGCPATAMAQIMKYWEYPTKGTGFHSYNHDKYGTLSANFGSTNYDWSNMPNYVNSTNNAVATLMYHCGVAVEMQYNVAAEGGSGSYVIKDEYNRYPETQTCEYAFPTYFGYANTTKGLYRGYYTDSEWIALMKQELDAGRPIQYAGYGQGGHTWVCDGYDNSDFFHMNWGWGGAYDGNFLLDALNPGSDGIGAGSGTFNNNQQALIGIQPESNQPEPDEEFLLYSEITINPSDEIQFGSSFSVHTDFLNNTSTDFEGDYCAAAFDKDNVFVDYIEIKNDWSLSSGYHYTYGVTFEKEASISLLPGEYYVCFFLRTDSNDEWTLIKDSYGGYKKDFEVIFTNDISLYSDINVNTNDIVSQGSLSANMDVANFSPSDAFNGELALAIYETDGEGAFVDEVEILSDINLPSEMYNTFNFSSTSIDAEPGTYLLALLHKYDTDDQFYLSGSYGGHVNPIKIIVKQAPFTEDQYEDNNEVDNAHEFVANYKGNVATFATTGTNFHVGSDWDYFSVDLDNGYDYSINARLHDEYNSGDGNEYSVDAMFLYSFDGDKWSDSYDDILPGSITAQGGKTLYFVTSPYFLGETGTYSFEVSITRSENKPDNIEETSLASIQAWPNPANDLITITANENINQVSLFDLTGKLIKTKVLNSTTGNLDIRNLNSGIYSLRIKTENGETIQKVIKE